MHRGADLDASRKAVEERRPALRSRMAPAAAVRSRGRRACRGWSRQLTLQARATSAARRRFASDHDRRRSEDFLAHSWCSRKVARRSRTAWAAPVVLGRSAIAAVARRLDRAQTAARPLRSDAGCRDRASFPGAVRDQLLQSRDEPVEVRPAMPAAMPGIGAELADAERHRGAQPLGDARAAPAARQAAGTPG